MSIAMPSRTAEPAFEIDTFRARPVDGGVAVLELRGRFTGPAPRRFDRARLRVERPFDVAELTALHDAGGVADGWSATFAVSHDALQDATFALAVARGLLLDLPAPDVVTPDGSPPPDYVRLARETNHSRRELLSVHAALEAEQEARALIQRHADDTGTQRDLALQERDVAREELRAGLDELDAERERVTARTAGELAAAHSGHEAALAEAQQGQERALGEAQAAYEDALAAAGAAHAQELAAAHGDGDVARANADTARDEADRARQELRTVRAELTDVRAELEAVLFEHERLAAVRPAGDPTATWGTDPLVEGGAVVMRRADVAAPTDPAEFESRGDHAWDEDDDEAELEPRSAAGAFAMHERFARLQEHRLAARPLEFLAVATAEDNRSRTIAMSVLAAAFFAFAAALGVGPL